GRVAIPERVLELASADAGLDARQDARSTEVAEVFRTQIRCPVAERHPYLRGGARHGQIRRHDADDSHALALELELCAYGRSRTAEAIAPRRFADQRHRDCAVLVVGGFEVPA